MTTISELRRLTSSSEGEREQLDKLVNRLAVLAGKGEVTAQHLADVFNADERAVQARLAIIANGGYRGRQAGNLDNPYDLKSAYDTLCRALGVDLGPRRLVNFDVAHLELRNHARDVNESGPPAFSAQGRPEFSRVMRGLVDHIAADLPPETAAELRKLKFSTPRPLNLPTNFSNYFGSWAHDVEVLWRVLSDHRTIIGEGLRGHHEAQARVARKIIDYIQFYAGFGRSGDKTPYEAKVFQFSDLTLEAFNKGALVKGALESGMTLQEVKSRIEAGAIRVTPQGQALLEHLEHLLEGNTRASLGMAFASLQRITIRPARGHDGSVIVDDQRMSAADYSQHVTIREMPDSNYGVHQFGSLVPSNLHDPKFHAGEKGSHKWVAGDGLAGEIGYHLLGELAAAGAFVYAPDVNLERSQVSAAAASLGLLLDQLSHDPSERNNLLLRSGQIYVGGANVMEPDRMAATLDALMPKGEKAVYISMAYAAGRQMEPLLVEGGALTARALIERDRVAGVLRLQSPSTPSLRKSDIAHFQGPWYLLAQFLKLAAALDENAAGTPSLLPRWPIVRTHSLTQNRFVAGIIGSAAKFGIRTASPAEAGSEAFIPAKRLLQGRSPGALNVRYVNDGRVTSNPHDLSRVIAQAAIHSAAHWVLPTFMSVVGK